MMLIAPMIEVMPIRWIAKIMNATLAPPCSASGGYIVQPPAGAPPGMNSVDSSRRERERQDPERPVVHARQRHVRRADLSGIIQFARPTNAGMIAPKIMTSACIVVIWLKNSGLHELQARLEQLGADHHRHRAADEEHHASAKTDTACRCPCGSSS